MPKFLKKPENQECLEYEDVTFTTKVSGKPKPEVAWFRGDLKLEPSDRIIYEEKEDNVYTITIKKVQSTVVNFIYYLHVSAQ